MPDTKNDMYQMNNAATIDQTWQFCTNLDMTMAMPLTNWMGATWSVGDMSCTTYNHVAPPNARTCAGMDSSMMMNGSMANMAVQLPPSSYHPGGVNVLFGDGSVRFMKESITLTVWRALEHAQWRRGRQRLGLLNPPPTASCAHGSFSLARNIRERPRPGECFERTRYWRAG